MKADRENHHPPRPPHTGRPDDRFGRDAMSRRGSRRKDTLPQLPPGGLRVVPLGGLGEIGRNMTVFEHAGRLLVVDCGVLFPEEHQPGVDVILPDFTWIRDRLDRIEAIVLTHGHEDHIGGVPYLLLERPDIPLVGSRLTLAFIKAKLKEHHITPKTVEVREGQRLDLGPGVRLYKPIGFQLVGLGEY
jgi:ribonuclease J